MQQTVFGSVGIRLSDYLILSYRLLKFINALLNWVQKTYVQSTIDESNVKFEGTKDWEITTRRKLKINMLNKLRKTMLSLSSGYDQ